MNTWELPYLKREVLTGSTPFGYEIVEGGDEYKGVYIRNRVVYRVDVIASMRKFFTAETLSAFRDLIFHVVSGYEKDGGKIAEYYKAFYCTDKTFKHYIAEVFYFDDRAVSESLYSIFVKDFTEEFRKKVRMFADNASAWDYRFLFEDRGKVYLAGRDENSPFIIPEGYVEEVLSVGKVWKGDFKRVEYDV